MRKVSVVSAMTGFHDRPAERRSLVSWRGDRCEPAGHTTRGTKGHLDWAWAKTPVPDQVLGPAVPSRHAGANEASSFQRVAMVKVLYFVAMRSQSVFHRRRAGLRGADLAASAGSPGRSRDGRVLAAAEHVAPRRREGPAELTARPVQLLEQPRLGPGLSAAVAKPEQHRWREPESGPGHGYAGERAPGEGHPRGEDTP
jgi:hypothetical protein